MQLIQMLSIKELRDYHTQKTTDFAYLTGAWQTERPRVAYQPSPFVDREKDFVDSPRFSATKNVWGRVLSFYQNGEDTAFPNERDMTIPLKMRWCSALTLAGRTFVNGAEVTQERNGGFTFSYGAYPQTVAPKKVAEMLEGAFQRKKLKKTHNDYTCFGADEGKAPAPKVCPEYEMKNARYVRLIPDKMHFLHALFTLSNKEAIQAGKPYWIRVEPLKWRVKNSALRPSHHPYVTAYLSVQPIAGITHDKVNSFLERHFEREMMQSHTFCYALSLLSSATRTRE